MNHFYAVVSYSVLIVVVFVPILLFAALYRFWNMPITENSNLLEHSFSWPVLGPSKKNLNNYYSLGDLTTCS